MTAFAQYAQILQRDIAPPRRRSYARLPARAKTDILKKEKSAAAYAKKYGCPQRTITRIWKESP